MERDPSIPERIGSPTEAVVSADLIWAVIWGVIAAFVASRVSPEWIVQAFLASMIVYIILIADW